MEKWEQEVIDDIDRTLFTREDVLTRYRELTKPGRVHTSASYQEGIEARTIAEVFEALTGESIDAPGRPRTQALTQPCIEITDARGAHAGLVNVEALMRRVIGDPHKAVEIVHKLDEAGAVDYIAPGGQIMHIKATDRDALSLQAHAMYDPETGEVAFELEQEPCIVVSSLQDPSFHPHYHLTAAQVSEHYGIGVIKDLAQQLINDSSQSGEAYNEAETLIFEVDHNTALLAQAKIILAEAGIALRAQERA